MEAGKLPQLLAMDLTVESGLNSTVVPSPEVKGQDQIQTNNGQKNVWQIALGNQAGGTEASETPSMFSACQSLYAHNS